MIHYVSRAAGADWAPLLTRTTDFIAAKADSYSDPPSGVPTDRWFQVVSPTWWNDAATMVHDILVGLRDQVKPRAGIAIDEVRGNTTELMEDFWPQVNAQGASRAEKRRIAVYLVNGTAVDYKGPIQLALERALKNDAWILPEFYWKPGGPSPTALLRGGDGVAKHRFPWLMKRRAMLGSESLVTPICAVGEPFVTRAQEIEMVVREWFQKSQWRSWLMANGVGTYVWKGQTPPKAADRLVDVLSDEMWRP